MKTLKEQLEQSKIQDRLFSGVPGYKPGIPCDHPGCASHLSHPCEGCGRYGAGMRNGPDIAAGRIYIQELAYKNPIIQAICRLQEKYNWSWQQAMIAIIIKQNEINKDLTNRLIEITQPSRDKIKEWDNVILNKPK